MRALKGPHGGEGAAQNVTTTMGIGALALVFLSYVLNQLDRTVISFVGPALKADLELSDTEFGILTGLAFSLTYGFCSFIFAYFADRRNRITILSGALFFWSLATVACAFAGSFRQLLVARMAVAVGEAGGTPTTLGLIGEAVPRERLASTYGIFMLATPLGILLAAVGGGYLAEHHGWRSAFLICGLPGIVLAVAIKFGLKDPRPSTSSQSGKSIFGSALTIVRELFFGIGEVWKVRSAFFILVSYGFSQFFLTGLLNWGPLYFSRYFGLDTQSASLQFGLAMILGLVPGLLIGGIVTDRLARSDTRRILDVPIMTLLFALPFIIAAFWVGSSNVALGLLTLGTFVTHLGVGGILGGYNGVLPSKIKALGNAIILFFATVISQGFGSFFIGFISDTFKETVGNDSLRLGIMVTSLTYGSIALMLLILARRHFKSDLERA
jgi:MFS transporter, Spinster family, sphingosine-1-phosphate transporter